jgi:hypothetical protein
MVYRLKDLLGHLAGEGPGGAGGVHRGGAGVPRAGGWPGRRGPSHAAGSCRKTSMA